MDLERFVQAQDDHGTYDRALSELRAGRKTSHWMWFVFPQVSGLGQSPTAKHFELAGLDEARAYLDHAVLGPRLLECCRALLALDGGQSAEEVLGSVDAMKLRSSMTLFARADPGEPLFPDVLDRFFDGTPDERTIRLLG
jgi:uncharacterized protein (DUF1810 family)